MKKGFERTDYNRNEYLQQLEEEAFERAKAEQQKLISEGKPLPQGVIRLVDQDKNVPIE